MADIEMRAWALKGAEQRLVEITDELASIHAAFPELRDRGQAQNGARRPGRPRKQEAATEALAPQKRRRRKMSKEARRKISEAQKARWAKQNGQGTTDATRQPTPPARQTEPGKKKRTMSAEARRKIGAAQKKRWQTQKAGRKSPSSAKTSK